MNYPKSKGFLMKNDRKEQETHPDATGKLEISAEQLEVLNQMLADGVEPTLQLGAWRSEAQQTGKPYTSISAQAYYDPDKAPQAKKPQKPAVQFEDSSEIPF